MKQTLPIPSLQLGFLVSLRVQSSMVKYYFSLHFARRVTLGAFAETEFYGNPAIQGQPRPEVLHVYGHPL